MGREETGDGRRSGKPFLVFHAGPEDEGRYLTTVLRTKFGVARGLIRRLKKPGCVLADGAPIPVRHRLTVGETIELYLPPSSESVVDPEPVPLDIVYEDRDLLVLDKPCGVLVHPAGPVLRGTLANGVAHHLKAKGEASAAGPVTRLDRGTSGLVAFAKHPHAHFRLSEALERGEVRRTYLAVVEGIVSDDAGVIDAPIGRVSGQISRRQVDPGGRPAVTHFTVESRCFDAQPPLSRASLLKLRLETGRTHQIRVHLAHIGHPVVGDPLYGRRVPGVIERQALHAHRLELPHPTDGRPLAFASPLPEDLVNLLRLLGADR